MLSKLNEYLEYKKYAWAPTTIQATKATLVQALPLSNPEQLFSEFQGKYKKYSLLINWNRVAAFVDFAFPNDINEYKAFLVKNRRLFKNAYVTEKLDITYQEAKTKLQALEEGDFKSWALYILQNGLRYSESLTQDDQGLVLGKGEKVREVLFPLSFKADKWKGHYTTFYRKLKKLGLKPHTLRKLAATRALQKGATLPDICQIFGWTNINTAARYLQPNKMNELRGLLG